MLQPRFRTFILEYGAFFPLLVVYLLTIQAPFFWDTTHLVSKQANWFWENGLFSIELQDQMDSGHPPLTPWLLAFFWHLVGKGLVQSHLFMLPFLVLLIVQWKLILTYYLEDKAVYVQFLVFLNPYFLAQAMLISPDILLLAFFGLCWHGILNRIKWKIYIGSIFLGLVSMRGMVCVLSLIVFAGYLQWRKSKDFKGLRANLMVFLPSLIASFSFLIYHFTVKKWIGYHAGSPWASSFQLVNLKGFIWNIGITIWRICDQGLIFIWMIPISVFFRKRSTVYFSEKTKELLFFLVILFCLLIIPQWRHAFLLMHRYFLPVLMVMSIFSGVIMVDNLKEFKDYILVGTFLMISGIFWIYPDPIAKGWDAMPMHYDFYNKYDKILNAIDEKHLQKQQIGASFPYEIPESVSYLSTDTALFKHFNLQRDQYILYSNVSNEFSKEELLILERTWKKEIEVGTYPIRFVLYKRINGIE